MVSCDTASASGITRGILLSERHSRSFSLNQKDSLPNDTSMTLPFSDEATITIINLTSTTIMCLALEFGSGGRKSRLLNSMAGC